METIVIVGVVLFILYGLANAFPVASTLTIIALASYIIYNFVLESRWLDRRIRNQKLVAEERQQAEAQRQLADQQAALALEWEQAQPLPDEKAIKQILLQHFDDTDSGVYRVIGDFAFQAAKGLKIDKTQMRPAEAHALYQKYIEAAIQTTRVYADATAQPPMPPGTFPSKYIFSENEKYLILAAARNEFGKWFQHWERGPWLPPPKDWSKYEKDDGTTDWKRYERDEKEHQKEIEKIYDALTEAETALLNTPLYSSANHIAPSYQYRPFTIPYTPRFAGTWIISPQGKGKTNLLWQLCDLDIKRGHTVIMMDSKGDFIKPYRNHPDAILLDKDTIGINPFQFGSSVRTMDFLEYIFSTLLDAKLTQLQTTLWRECLELLLRLPNATMETLREVLVRGLTPEQRQVAKTCPPATRDFFLDPNQPDYFLNKDYIDTRRGILWRIRALLSRPETARMFTAKKSSHDFFKLLDSRKIIVIDNSKDDLGDEGAEFLGKFFVALVWRAATTRSKLNESEKIPVSFYIDECHTVLKNDSKIRGIIQECRSQKIALTAAHQYISDISTEAQPALFNCAVRIANAAAEASEIAPRLNIKDPGSLKLPDHNFMVAVDNDEPVAIRVPFFDLASVPQKPPQPAAPPPELNVTDPEVTLPDPPKKKQKPFKKDRNPQNGKKKIW